MPIATVMRYEGRMKASPTSVAPQTREWMKPRQMASWAARGPGAIWESTRLFLYSSRVNHRRFSTRSRCM